MFATLCLGPWHGEWCAGCKTVPVGSGLSQHVPYKGCKRTQGEQPSTSLIKAPFTLLPPWWSTFSSRDDVVPWFIMCWNSFYDDLPPTEFST